MLHEVGTPGHPVASVAALVAAIDDDTSFVVVTEETLRNVDLQPLSAKLRGQPGWSDLPFIVLTRQGGGPERNPAALRLAQMLGNVSFAERPFHPTTFVSLANSALKNRQRQYEARARAEQLREGDERLRTALAAGRLGSWELDLSTGELSASATCKAAFGRGPDEAFTYADMQAAIHPDDRGRIVSEVQQTIGRGSDVAIDFRTIWPDGGTHWIEANARRFAGYRLVGVTQDITARKEAELELASAHEMLEQRVEERTRELQLAHERVLAEIAQRELTEEQLRQAQKMEMIGQLTGGVAHDFNNLLMAVISNLDVLRKHVPDDSRARRLIDGAMQGAERGASLTQRLLAFARRQDLQLVPKDVSALVSGVTELLAKSVGPAIELDYRLGASLKPAELDANQVELALLNLVVNARDAMPQGGTITIATDQVTLSGDPMLADGDYIRVAVSDTGHGMDRQTLEKATEPFFSTKELGKGTGLGLSMIHGLAIQLNGALRLTSEEGAGTRAELLLPTAVAGVSQAEAAPEPEAAGASRTAARTILVVDDDALIAMSTVDMLEDLGHTVIETNSGAAALDIIRSGQHIDIMVTDYSMPQMNGGQLSIAARALRPDLPILLATGYAELPSGSEIDLPRLSKPYHQQQIAVAIAKLLEPAG